MTHGTPFLSWNKDIYGTGVFALDKQQQDICDFLNHLYAEVSRKKDVARILDVLDGLISCMNTHFDSEEKSMRQKNYPARLPHIEKHLKMMNGLTLIRKNLAKKQKPFAADDLVFLKDWLNEHFSTEENKFGKWLAKQKP